MEGKLNILIVYAHPEDKSFNGAMRRTAETTLGELGHEVMLSDLYRDRFRAGPDPAEFADRADPDHFELMREQAWANETGALADDVAREQARVAWADSILLQFPLWWWSFPAILKGWVDRVLSNGFAYGDRDLAPRSAMLCLTAETKAKRFAGGGAKKLIDPMQRGTLGYCGLTLLPHFAVPEVLTIGDPERARKLDEFASHLRDHFS
jgi:NAD(P)H dehydrogenase (quinone)